MESTSCNNACVSPKIQPQVNSKFKIKILEITLQGQRSKWRRIWRTKKARLKPDVRKFWKHASKYRKCQNREMSQSQYSPIERSEIEKALKGQTKTNLLRSLFILQRFRNPNIWLELGKHLDSCVAPRSSSRDWTAQQTDDSSQDQDPDGLTFTSDGNAAYLRI